MPLLSRRQLRRWASVARQQRRGQAAAAVVPAGTSNTRLPPHWWLVCCTCAYADSRPGSRILPKSPRCFCNMVLLLPVQMEVVTKIIDVPHRMQTDPPLPPACAWGAEKVCIRAHMQSSQLPHPTLKAGQARLISSSSRSTNQSIKHTVSRSISRSRVEGRMHSPALQYDDAFALGEAHQLRLHKTAADEVTHTWPLSIAACKVYMQCRYSGRVCRQLTRSRAYSWHCGKVMR